MQSPKSLDAVGDDPVGADRVEEGDPVETADDASADVSAAPDNEKENEPHPAAQGTRVGWLWAALTLLFVAALLLSRLAQFGIWDPWELEVADAARARIEGASAASGHSLVPSLGAWLVTVGFRTFGIHEWAGRLPFALSGVMVAVAAFALALRLSDLRTATYAALIAATSPLLAFNARTMLGAAPDMAVTSALGLCAFAAVLGPFDARRERSWHPAAWLLGALMLLGLTLRTRGALLSALPPLGGAAAAAWLAPMGARSSLRRSCGYVLAAAFLLCAGFIARDVQRDAPDFSIWLGGAATSLEPPTFDFVLEQVFHAFAPWSALLPLALSRVPFAQSTTSGARFALIQGCTAWAALSYGAQTLFMSRYGHQVTYLAVLPLSLLVANLIRDLEDEGRAGWGSAIAVLLLSGLLLRDFALFPNGMVEGMPVQGFEVPKDWNPRGALSAVCIPFGLLAALGLAVARAPSRPDLRAPYRFLAAQWRRGRAFKAWLSVVALLLLGACILGVLAYMVPRRLHVPSLAIKVMRPLTLAPVALGAVVALAQLSFYGFGRLGAKRYLPLLAAGAAFGAYAAQGYLPHLSEHFSPRDVYTTYNQLAAPGAELAEYRVGGRAAPYYADGPVIELTSLSQLVDHLAQEGQHWATFPGKELATIDHAYRKKTGRHLFVVDAQSERGMLAATEPIPDRVDENKLAGSVRREAPEPIANPVTVNFDDRIELLGYALDLPHENYVGAGESFTLTWYFRSTRKLSSSYRVFVHIDGEGRRIHGDHDPVEGVYPVTLWEPDDIIVDSQKIDVPASSHAGEYRILMGFYSGDTRLPIRQGPNAGEDRARVGVLRIR